MKVGIIGYGLMGKRRREVLPPDTQVVTVDVGDAIGPACDCDATIVSVPTPNLAGLAVEAMVHGARYLLLEKPCGETPDQLMRVVEAAERFGAVVVPGYTLRHFPGIKAARWDARYGDLLWLSAQYGHGGGAEGWRATSGELLDQGSHLLDLAQWLDHCGITGATLARIETEFVEDHVSITYGHHTLMASWAMWKPTFRLALYYQRGSCVVSGLGGAYGEHCVEWRDRDGRVDEVRNYGDARNAALRSEWQSFLDTVDMDRFRDAIRVLELIEEARRCAS